MATIGAYDEENFKKVNKTQVRPTVEAVFYGNNVHAVDRKSVV